MAPAPYLAVGQVIESAGEVVAPIVGWAQTPRTRIRGLLGRTEMIDHGAFVLCGARQVHTFGLDRPIDVALCDRNWRVLHVARSMRPNRIGRAVLRAHFAIEARAGAFGALTRGDRLSLRDS